MGPFKTMPWSHDVPASYTGFTTDASWKLQGHMYALHDMTTFSLATRGELCVLTCRRVSKIPSKWIPSLASAEASALPSCLTPWALAIDIWRPLLRTTIENKYVVIVSILFSGLTQATPTASNMKKEAQSWHKSQGFLKFVDLMK